MKIAQSAKYAKRRDLQRHGLSGSTVMRASSAPSRRNASTYPYSRQERNTNAAKVVPQLLFARNVGEIDFRLVIDTRVSNPVCLLMCHMHNVPVA